MKINQKLLADKVARLEQLKHDKLEIDGQIRELQTDIIDTLDRAEQKSISVELDGRTIKATKVQGVKTTIDENSLKRSLGEKLWMKVSTRMLDKKKLEAFIATGEVDPMVVAECSTESGNAPYVKIT